MSKTEPLDGQVVDRNEQGRFTGGSMTSEEAARRGALGGRAKQKDIAEDAQAVLDEIRQAGGNAEGATARLLAEQLAGKGAGMGATFTALLKATGMVGDKDHLTKPRIGERCSLCGQVVVSFDYEALSALREILPLNPTDLRQLADQWEESGIVPSGLQHSGNFPRTTP